MALLENQLWGSGGLSEGRLFLPKGQASPWHYHYGLGKMNLPAIDPSKETGMARGRGGGLHYSLPLHASLTLAASVKSTLCDCHWGCILPLPADGFLSVGSVWYRNIPPTPPHPSVWEFIVLGGQTGLNGDPPLIMESGTWERRKCL